LEKGRKKNGTHFIWLDADEVFTYPFLKNSRKYIERLKPGEKLAMKWLTTWKTPYFYRDDKSIWSNIMKDFIVYDIPEYNFEDKYLSEGRTQGGNTEENLIEIKPEDGSVIHFEYVPWMHFQVKQAWYRCIELIKQPEKAFLINTWYSITLDDPHVGLKKIPKEWLNGIYIPENINNLPAGWRLEEILKWFDEYGIEFFEPLQIWHVEELYDEFLKRIKRKPEPLLRPPLFSKLMLDTIFNKLKLKVKKSLPDNVLHTIKKIKENHKKAKK
jgi:hypothetical protein